MRGSFHVNADVANQQAAFYPRGGRGGGDTQFVHGRAGGDLDANGE